MQWCKNSNRHICQFFVFLMTLGSFSVYCSHAQNIQDIGVKYNHFIPGKDVVFYEDFFGVDTNSWPASWEKRSIMTWKLLDSSREGAQVKLLDGIYSLLLPAGHNEYVRAKIRHVLCDTCYTTIEFDYRYSGATERVRLDVNYDFGAAWETAECTVYKDGKVSIGFLNSERYATTVDHKVKEYHIKNYSCDTTRWHHFAASLKYKAMTLYVDHAPVFKNEYLHLYPKTFNLSDFCYITNVRIAQNEQSLNYQSDTAFNFNKIENTVLFDVGSSRISSGYTLFIRKLSEWLISHKTVKLLVRGYTDSTGDVKSNLLLSQERAKSVRDRLIAMGAPPDNLEAIGYGASKDAGDRTKIDWLQKNRRVDFVRK